MPNLCAYHFGVTDICLLMLQPGKSPIYPSPLSKLPRYLAMAVLPLLTVALAQPSFAAAAARKHRTTKVASSHAGKSRRTSAKKPIGPRGIDDARASQIQAALIKAGYLTGEPSGHWDAASQAAMEKLQSDNGWQTKLVPDSRALIKLGLGPSAAPGAVAAAQSTTSTASNSVPNAQP
jgi:lipid-binding SYLF domain-containing protein